jgi:hypothetical protein
MRKFLLYGFMLSVLCLLQSACRKTVHENVHENLIVPVDHGTLPTSISTVDLEAYINKLYVDLLGREPLAAELSAAVSDFRSTSTTVLAKENLVNQLMLSHTFFEQLFIKTSNNVLNGTSKLEIAQQGAQFQSLYQSSLANNDQVGANYMLSEYNRVVDLYHSDSLYRIGNLSINQFYARFLNNYFYDQINMGSENFVKACFENLFHRAATANELAAGKTMVDGFNAATLFGQSGTGKGDFIQIVAYSNDFYEGMIRGAYLNFLLREPSATEIHTLQDQLAAHNHDYLFLLKTILASQNYAGF